jgi:hypothetical protein
MFAAEGHSMKTYLQRLHVGLRPKVLTITFRYTDWWNWENNSHLRMEDWPLENEFPCTLEKLVMQFETRNGKRDELHRILNHTILRWRIPQCSGVVNAPNRVLTTTREQARTYTWIGPDIIRDSRVAYHPSTHLRPYPHHAQRCNGTKDLKEGEMLYYVAVVEWKHREE